MRLFPQAEEADAGASVLLPLPPAGEVWGEGCDPTSPTLRPARSERVRPVPATRAAGERLYVVSGCSGSGKSTLIAALARRGEAVAVEPGRAIVKSQLAAGEDGLPWANAQRFIDLCAARAIADFDRRVRGRRRAFFDRSFIDVASAVERSGLAAPVALTQALESKRYAPLVFITAPWAALFAPDAQRRHGFSEALAEYAALVPTYRRHGYAIVFIPPLPVVERVAFVLATVAKHEAAAG